MTAINFQLGEEFLSDLTPALFSAKPPGRSSVFGASEFQLGYVIYGVRGVFGIIISSILAFSANGLSALQRFLHDREAGHRVHDVAVILVAGLTILVVHLAVYPWPSVKLARSD
jgi:hypothetical protein